MRTAPFEANPEMEFEFFLAAELGMTVGRLRQEMSSDEFTRWCIYYGRKAQQEDIARQKARG